MQEKTTSELEKELSGCTNLSGFLKENEPFFQKQTVSDCLQELLEAKGLVRSEVIRKSGMNDVYAYQIFSGSRLPSRSKLLCLCFGMELNAEETQRMLKACGYRPLYVKSKRDSVILHALYNGTSLLELNELLFDYQEELLE